MSEEEANFFAAPPAEEAAGGEPPIVLAPPPAEEDAFAADAFAADAFAAAPSAEEDQAAYLGEVNEAPSAEEPIILGGGAPEEDIPAGDDLLPPAPEEEPTGEPSPMAKWNAEWQETLKVRKDEENARKAEMIEEARVALEQFQAEREQAREKAMAKNREDEQAKLEGIEADLENDNSWQRVCKLVDLQHDSTEKSQDVKRMRDVMILLKNEPTKAQEFAA
jgi:hypothetical protein